MDNILKLFILGITMSFGPCFIFCSPIPLIYIAATKTKWKDGLRDVLIFSSARMVSHSVLGLFAGWLGIYFTDFLNRGKNAITLSGSFIISVIGIFIIFGNNRRYSLCGIIRSNFIDKKAGGIAVLGIITGILPCLSLFGVLVWITLNTDNWWRGAVYGLAFGAGGFMSPLLILGVLIPYFPNFLKSKDRIFSLFTKICGLILFAIGVKMFFAALL